MCPLYCFLLSPSSGPSPQYHLLQRQRRPSLEHGNSHSSATKDPAGLAASPLATPLPEPELICRGSQRSPGPQPTSASHPAPSGSTRRCPSFWETTFSLSF